jgi:hypothetical protein
MSERRDQQDSLEPKSSTEVSGVPMIPSPGAELETFIARMTPSGALTWRTLPTELPWTRPPMPLDGKRPSKIAMTAALSAVGVKEPAEQSYVMNGPFTEIMVYSPRELHRNYGLPARAIEVAAEHDITGSDLADIASRLDLSDHRTPVPTRSDTVAGDPRGGRRYLSRGRQILAQLGVWPWTHVDSWVRTRRWWESDDVLRALLIWHDQAWIRATEDLVYCARTRYVGKPFRAVTIQEHHACVDFRARLAALARGAAPTD